jgi:hypothetical protein
VAVYPDWMAEIATTRARAVAEARRLFGGVLFASSLSGCGSDEGGGSGPSRLELLLTASYAPIAHTGQSSGQTPMHASAGLRSLTLISDSGPSWVVVDRAKAPGFVRYDAGARNLIGVVMADQVVLGHYTRVRLVHDWWRFELAATLHEDGGATPGALAALYVTSDGTSIAGEPQAAGYFLHDFTAGEEHARFTGNDTEVPQPASPEGAELVLEGGEYAAYFPADLQVSGDGALVIQVNLFEGFRWNDVAGAGHLPGVYDVEPAGHEPLVQLGANRFEATFRKR